MAQTPEEMAASMIANLEEKTGKNLAEWLEITRNSGLEKHGQIVKLLKSEHGMTHGYANLVAHETLREGTEQPTEDDLVDSQYSGAKADLRPIYDSLIRELLPSDALENLGSVSWYTTTVKLDLEARGELERVPGSRPQRLRRC